MDRRLFTRLGRPALCAAGLLAGVLAGQGCNGSEFDDGPVTIDASEELNSILLEIGDIREFAGTVTDRLTDRAYRQRHQLQTEDGEPVAMILDQYTNDTGQPNLDRNTVLDTFFEAITQAGQIEVYVGGTDRTVGDGRRGESDLGEFERQDRGDNTVGGGDPTYQVALRVRLRVLDATKDERRNLYQRIYRMTVELIDLRTNRLITTITDEKTKLGRDPGALPS